MDIFLIVKVLIFTSLLILYFLQGKRKPEQVIREEQPVIQAFMTNKSPMEVLIATQSVVGSKGLELYEMNEESAIFISDTSLWNSGYVLAVETNNHNERMIKVMFSLYPRTDILTTFGAGRYMRKKRVKRMVNILRDRLNLQ